MSQFPNRAVLWLNKLAPDAPLMSGLLKNLFNTNTGDARRGAEVVDNQLPGGQAVDQVQPVEQRLPARLAVIH